LYTITANKDGLIYFNEVQYEGSEWTTTRSPLISVNGNTKYALTLTNDVRVLALMEYDSSKKCIGMSEMSLSACSFTTKKETRYILCKIGKLNAVNGTVYTTQIQLEKGSATPYEPYKETLSTIPTENGLAGIKVSSGGNYTDSNGQQWICDEIVKYADGSGKHIQRVKKAVFDGSEDEIIKSSSTNNYGYITHELKINGVVAHQEIRSSCSSHFNYLALWQSNGFNFYNTNVGVIILTKFETVDLLREFLNTNPVTFVVPITPIVTPLTAEEIAEIEKLHTFYPITNISNDFDCGMSVTYNADSKNYIDNKIAILTTAMVNNI
jgi:hypothetical protein